MEWISKIADCKKILYRCHSFFIIMCRMLSIWHLRCAAKWSLFQWVQMSFTKVLMLFYSQNNFELWTFSTRRFYSGSVCTAVCSVEFAKRQAHFIKVNETFQNLIKEQAMHYQHFNRILEHPEAILWFCNWTKIQFLNEHSVAFANKQGSCNIKIYETT